MIANDAPGGSPAAPATARNPRIGIIVFVIVWVALFLVLGFFHLAGAGLAAWGAGDAGYYDEPLYQVGLYGSFLLFGATQLGALIGGVMILSRGLGVVRLILLLAGLYGLWFFGTICAFSLR